jgi:hypothetical protein
MITETEVSATIEAVYTILAIAAGYLMECDRQWSHNEGVDMRKIKHEIRLEISEEELELLLDFYVRGQDEDPFIARWETLKSGLTGRIDSLIQEWYDELVQMILETKNYRPVKSPEYNEIVPAIRATCPKCEGELWIIVDDAGIRKCAKCGLKESNE